MSGKVERKLLGAHLLKDQRRGVSGVVTADHGVSFEIHLTFVPLLNWEREEALEARTGHPAKQDED